MSKVGYVAVIGRPNAGKSTFLNALIAEKVSSISYRPQTTQRKINVIYSDEEKDTQIIFVDTPGIHEVLDPNPKNINHRINYEAFGVLRNADIILRFVDPTRPYGKEDEKIDEIVSFYTAPVFRVETKQDLPISYPGKDIDFKINSITGNGFQALIDRISQNLPDGPFLYDPDVYTDQSIDFRVQEVLRETLFLELGDEIPYACYSEVVSVENTENLLKLQVNIFTESESQKKILIGKQGKKIQSIGTSTRHKLEDIFDKKVFLGLRVKVSKNWRKNEKILNTLFPKR
ncbi:GTPase Era [Candidatus Gracilibacteria bacterium]|nr:MAG: GTPase Era [Candidatus Gracilibacteria bacterium]